MFLKGLYTVYRLRHRHLCTSDTCLVYDENNTCIFVLLHHFLPRHFYTTNFFHVAVYPRLTASTPEIYQAVGYGRDLQCEAKGNPVPGPGQLLWYKEGVPLADTNK